MEVTEAIRNRKSTRAFLPNTVDRETITSILECARWAPSGVNLQPWQVAVVTGETKRQLAEALAQCRANAEPARQDTSITRQRLRNPTSRVGVFAERRFTRH